MVGVCGTSGRGGIQDFDEETRRNETNFEDLGMYKVDVKVSPPTGRRDGPRESG